MARDSWYKIDNVGQFYAAEASHSMQTVFRVSATFEDEIDPKLLQAALDGAVSRNPRFNVCLKSGFFWHYLEPCSSTPTIQPDDLPICYGLYAGPRSVLFRVTYYQKRVNLEVSHIISDGRGAFRFFKDLVSGYSSYKYGTKAPEGTFRDPSDVDEDGFAKHYQRDKAKPTPAERAYHIRSIKDMADPAFMEYHLSAASVKECAKRIGVSVTSVLVAAIIKALAATRPARDADLPIRLTVPVDLRRFFETDTTRNFFGLITVTYEKQGVEPFEWIARDVQDQIKKAAVTEELEKRMNRMISIEKNPFIRNAPLFLKDAALAFGDLMNAREITCAVSSVGKVSFGEEVDAHVESAGFLTSSTDLNFIVCTFEDDLCIGISTVYKDREVLDELEGVLQSEGIVGRIEGIKNRKDLRKENKTARRVMSGLTLLAVIVVIAGGCMMQASALSVVAMNAMIIAAYIYIRNLMLHSPDVLRVTERYFLMLFAVCTFWFIATNNETASTYVLPFLSITATAFNTVLLAMFRGAFVSGYAKYLLYDIVMGVFPLFLVAFGMTTTSIPAVLCASAAVLLSVLMGLLARKQTAEETEKLFSN